MPKHTHIEIVLDRSGSMERLKADTEGGLRSFLASQAETEGKVTVSLSAFDDRIDPVYTDLPLDAVPTYLLVPRGGTALLDAIGFTITALKARLKALPEEERPDAVVFVIVTDGAENASREYVGQPGLAAIETMIQKRRKKGWIFTFLGADQDAIAVAAGMGIPRMSAISFSGKKAGETFAVVGTMVSRGAKSGTYAYDDDERGQVA